MRAVTSLGTVAGALVCLAALRSCGAGQDSGTGGGREHGRPAVRADIQPSAGLRTEARWAPDAQISGVTLMRRRPKRRPRNSNAFSKHSAIRHRPDYQNWLTPEQYGDRFGLRENDFGMVGSWLEAGGFTIEDRARARNWIRFQRDGGGHGTGVSCRAASIQRGWRGALRKQGRDSDTRGVGGYCRRRARIGRFPPETSAYRNHRDTRNGCRRRRSLHCSRRFRDHIRHSEPL